MKTDINVYIYICGKPYPPFLPRSRVEKEAFQGILYTEQDRDRHRQIHRVIVITRTRTRQDKKKIPPAFVLLFPYH